MGGRQGDQQFGGAVGGSIINHQNVQIDIMALTQKGLNSPAEHLNPIVGGDNNCGLHAHQACRNALRLVLISAGSLPSSRR